MKSCVGFFVFVCFTQYLDAAEDPYVPIVLGDGSIPVDGCPVMRVFQGQGKGIYNYFKVYNVWRNADDVMNLNANNLYFKVGAREQYNEENNTFANYYATGPDIAECVFSRNYCYQVDIRTNSVCGSGLWTKVTSARWTLESKPGYYLVIGEDTDVNGDRNWECHDSSGLRDSISTKYFITSCIDDVLYEGVKYGFNYYYGSSAKYDEKVFLVGEGSPDPMVYREGAFFRMYQITTPETDTDMMVYPRYGQYYGDSVVVLTSFGTDPTAFPVITDLRHSFRLHNPKNCAYPGGKRMNVLQMKAGTYVSGAEQVIAQRGITLENQTDKLITFPSAFVNESGSLPIVIGQVYDPVGASLAVHRIKKSTHTELSVNMQGNFGPGTGTATSTEFGYVAMHSQHQEFATPIWGSNFLVEDWTITSNNNHTVVSAKDYADGEEVLLFSDLQTYTDGEEVSRVIISNHTFGTPEFSISTFDYCSPQIPDVRKVAVAMFGVWRKRETLVREAVPGISTVACQILYGAGSCPHGMYVAKKMFSEYHLTSGGGYVIKFEGGQAYCFKDSVKTGPADVACITSGTFCTKLTILNQQCRGTYNWVGPGHWANGSADDNYKQITHQGQYNNGYMRLHCETNNGESIYPNMRYVCDNEFAHSGVAYGLNKFGDEYVYIVGDHMMSVGWAYRLFTVTMPADGSPVWVYPTANAWTHHRGYGIKAQVHTTNKYPITYVSDFDYDGNMGFKLEVVYGDCGHYGGEVVNIMQVRHGLFTHGTEQLAAGHVGFWDECKECPYWYAEGDKGTVFAWTPKLFIQIQEVYIGPTTHNFIFGEYTLANEKKFYAYIDGYQRENGWYVLMSWIGMMMDLRASTVRTMLSALDYSSKSIFSETNHLKSSTPDTRRPYTARPFIFAEKFDHDKTLHYPIILPASNSTSFQTIIGNYQCDPTIKNQVKDVGYDVTSIGETVEPVRLRVVDFGENQRGCPLMRGYGACNKLFYPDHGAMYTRDNLHVLFKRLDGLWECCETDSTVTPGPACKSEGSVIKGERIADCLTSETFCDYIDVYVETYGGAYPTKVDASTFTRSDGKQVKLKKGDGREMTAAILDSSGAELTTVNASQMNCGRNNPIDTKYGRASYGDHEWGNFVNYYLVKDQYVEGPGSSYSLHHGPDETSGVVWYKYFQIEITEADVLVPLYVHVPGAHFVDPVAVATAHHTSTIPMSINFQGVTANGIRVEVRMPECQGGFVSEKVNILIVEAGKRKTYDEYATFDALVWPFNGDDSYGYKYNADIPPVFLTDIQSTNIKQIYLSTRTWNAPNLVTVFLEIESDKTVPEGAISSVGIIAVRFKRKLEFAESGRDRIYGHHSFNEDWHMNSKPRTFPIGQGLFETAPIIFSKVASFNELDPCEMRIVNATAIDFTLEIVEEGCTGTDHTTEEWSVLMFGPSARTVDIP